ncbi:hypothetical protein [Desulfosporosinus sp. BG]|uniref:hypothetical protein n=1 Tax=Desulfosporosinus sp. BG TaxID=1633135 RepID=UPI0008554D93|nr:hypothetical protein [Desulfosporosinus sp. BG]ODA42026.1 hypothetical protein DSBG_1080 [Desulfosporosinus sp. BG]
MTEELRDLFCRDSGLLFQKAQEIAKTKKLFIVPRILSMVSARLFQAVGTVNGNI